MINVFLRMICNCEKYQLKRTLYIHICTFYYNVSGQEIDLDLIGFDHDLAPLKLKFYSKLLYTLMECCKNFNAVKFK